MDTHTGPLRNAIEIRMAATPAWIPIARTVATQLADRTSFDDADLCDIRLAVDEACTAAAAQTPDDGTLTCTFAVGPDRIEIEVTGPATPDPAPFSALAWRMLRAVTDELVLRHHPGHEISIRMAKHHPQ